MQLAISIDPDNKEPYKTGGGKTSKVPKALTLIYLEKLLALGDGKFSREEVEIAIRVSVAIGSLGLPDPTCAH